VNRTVKFLPALMAGVGLLAGAAMLPAQSKVAVIDMRGAIESTQEGQKAAGELKTRYEPRQSEIKQKGEEVNLLQEQLKRGSNTLSDEAKQKLVSEIDQKTKSYNRVAEDAQSDYQQDVNRITQELGQKVYVVLQKYALDNGYTLVLDIAGGQGPVLWNANGIDITADIVKLYDKNAPVAGSTPRPAAASPARQVPPTKPPGSQVKPPPPAK
jgi:outer membrane protein